MDASLTLQPNEYCFNEKITLTELMSALEMHFSRAISILCLTSNPIFQQNCMEDQRYFFSMLLSLGLDTKTLFEVLFNKTLTLTSIHNDERVYQINTNFNKLTLYDKLVDKVSQLISLINLSVDSLFVETCHQDKLNFILSVKDTLSQAKTLLETSFLCFPDLYAPQQQSVQLKATMKA